jgi:hypothetical protein
MICRNGLGVPFMGFHHPGGHLGNWGTIQRNLHGMSHRPTIDTVTAHAPGFYERTPLAHAMLCSAEGAASWGYENPRQKQGPVVRSAPAGNSSRLFERIYARPLPASPTPTASQTAARRSSPSMTANPSSRARRCSFGAM